jgi:hypothetical protein
MEWPPGARKLPGGGKLLRFWIDVGSYFEKWRTGFSSDPGKADFCSTWNNMRIGVDCGMFHVEQRSADPTNRCTVSIRKAVHKQGHKQSQPKSSSGFTTPRGTTSEETLEFPNALICHIKRPTAAKVPQTLGTTAAPWNDFVRLIEKDLGVADQEWHSTSAKYVAGHWCSNSRREEFSILDRVKAAFAAPWFFETER